MKHANELKVKLNETEYEDLMKIIERGIEMAVKDGADEVDIIVGNFSDESIEKAVETLNEHGYRAYSWEQKVPSKKYQKIITIRWK